ncbi:MAG: OmpA family protein [Solidesulfovibrio sp. DCME]|uniref:OmpA/MotB family protein n=1 Tax=Solidesulfovibrio sp. DCME TaxID=3447380 RepID=UPI003D10F557
MRGRLLKVLMVVLVLLPVGLTAYLANNLYHRKGVPEALENLTKQLFRSKEDERKAEARAVELERKADELQTAYDALVADLRGEVDSRDIRVRQFREKLEINFVDKVLFASGSAEITPHGREILLKVGGVLAKVKDKGIYVVGHTDSNPIHSALYPSNWELSTARSASVIRYLSEQGGLNPERFTAMGRAFYQPVASNATPEGRQENRRVDVIVADVPLLSGETGSESMRGTVSGDKTPVAATAEPALVRETAPPPPPAPAQPPGPGRTEAPQQAQPQAPAASGQAAAADSAKEQVAPQPVAQQPVAPQPVAPAPEPQPGGPAEAVGAEPGQGAAAVSPKPAPQPGSPGEVSPPETGQGRPSGAPQPGGPDLPPALPDKPDPGKG